VVVDVGGAVRQPGVYRLAIGSRVVDALEAAGGPADDIDLDHINLAATVADGQRVWISRRGELPPIGASTSAGSSGGSANAGPLDLNSATLEQLDALTGVGPATAKAIIDRRTQLGRFRSVDDLLTVKGIGSSKLDSIRSSVVVR
jgi:competence protein ComEA